MSPLPSQNISNIVVSAQSVDQALLASTGAACALSIYDPTGATPPGFFCIHGGAGGQVTDSPFPGEQRGREAGSTGVRGGSSPL